MSGGTTIEAPKPDPAQTAYFDYMRQHQQDLDRQTQQAATEEKANLAAVKSTGIAGYNAFKQNVINQWHSGLLDTEAAKNQLTGYEDRYKLGTGYTQTDLNSLVNEATRAQPGKLNLLAGQTYKDILGRPATQAELQSFGELSKTGGYKLADLVNTIKSGAEYQKAHDDNYLSSYYKTMYGTPQEITDKTGKTTKKYTFTFNTALDPTFSSDLSKTTGISTGNTLNSFTGTPAEIEHAQQAQRQKNQFAYDAGLTALQGEIDKNVQKVKNEGGAEVQRIASTGQLMSNLTQGFWA